MTLTRSFIRNAPTTPLDARLMNMAGLVCNADGTPRIGVLGGAATTLVTALATMHVAVAAAEFATSKSKADGVAIFTNDGTVNVAITAAPASNSRIDVIWVKHNDDTTGDANALPVFGVTAGVAAASPTKPAIPTGALELATLRVYAGTTAANGGANTLVNTFAMTVARGGLVPFRDLAEIALWTNAIVGQQVVALDTGVIYVRSSTAWVPATFSASILMRRSAAVGNIASASYTNISPSTFWTEASRLGFNVYANGVTIPFSGIYRVSYTLATTAIACIAGITINKSASVNLNDLECASAGGLAQGLSIASCSVEITLNANDVIRLFAIANTGTASWRVEPALSVFQVEYIRAA